MTNSVMNFRVEKELKDAFEIAAKSNDLTSSQLLRLLMRQTVADYMAKNAQGSLLDEKKPATNTPAKAKQKKRPTGSVIPTEWRKGR